MFPFFLGEKTKKSHTLIIFMQSIFAFPVKILQTEYRIKMNSFISYAKVQPIFAFSAKI